MVLENPVLLRVRLDRVFLGAKLPVVSQESRRRKSGGGGAPCRMFRWWGFGSPLQSLSGTQLLISPAEASVLLVLDGRGLGGLCAGL